jgi:hypothetical protein
MSRKGPFGLWMGMRLDELNSPYTEVVRGKYKPESVPIPHSAFESYVLQVTPKSGLSWAKAIGKTIQTSVFGVELKSSFDTMEGKLVATYGKGHRTDLLMNGSIWNEPKEWMMSMVKKERFLMTEWSAKYGSSLVDSLISVFLVASALNTSSGYIAIEYSFENKPMGDTELSALEDQAL